MNATAELQARLTRGNGRAMTLYAFQQELATRDKRSAVDLICATFPHISRSWAKRHLKRIQDMDGARLGAFLQTADLHAPGRPRQLRHDLEAANEAEATA